MVLTARPAVKDVRKRGRAQVVVRMKPVNDSILVSCSGNIGLVVEVHFVIQSLYAVFHSNAVGFGHSRILFNTVLNEHGTRCMECFYHLDGIHQDN